jgi:hypothetical protein
MPAASAAIRFRVTPRRRRRAERSDLLELDPVDAFAAGDQVDGERRQHRRADVAQCPVMLAGSGRSARNTMRPARDT